jgi:hypothetical protein
MSCTAYALAAEKANIVPAIQTSAAVLGGYQAEQVVQLLHGRLHRLGQRSYGNVRRETLQMATLTVSDRCPNLHHLPEPVIGTVRGLGAAPTLRDFICAVTSQFGPAGLRLSEPVIPTLSCTSCKEPCLVQATESSWLAAPRCTECGGPWPRTEASSDSVTEIDTGHHLTDELLGTPLASVGLRAGASVIATLGDGRSGLLRIAGDILDCVERAVPVDRAATDL